jgi:hypothetical protein
MGEIAIVWSRILLIMGRVFVSIMSREMLLITIVDRFTLIVVVLTLFVAIIVSIIMVGRHVAKFFVRSRIRGWMNRAVA